MSSIHLEIFDHNRYELFDKLKRFGTIGYLAGGTALALQINHRKSYDFDIFSANAITNELRFKIREAFGDVEYLVDSGDQLSFQSSHAIHVTFLFYYFKPLNPFIVTSSLPLASLDDIAADKAYTMGRRAAWRDYVDLYWLIKHVRYTLESISNLASQKFGGAFSQTQFLEQLTYYHDVSLTPIEYIDTSVGEEEIKSYLQKSVRDYVSKRIV